MTTELFDECKFEKLQGKVLGDVSGALGLFMAYIGDQSGIYQLLEKTGAISHEELAKASGIDERYLREWLSANAALGYIDYDSTQDKFILNPEQAALFSHEGEPTCMQGFFQTVISQIATHDTAIDVFKTGRGRPWEEHDGCCFCGTDRFFRPGYAANLVENWIPSLNGIEERLNSGAKIGDIGCGYGSSSILMAKSFPNSTVYGIDFHSPSIKAAKEKAIDLGLSNVNFQVSSAKDFNEKNFDLICIFDALHDMGDPVGAAKHIRKSLNPGGIFMIVEPMANDNLGENLNLLSSIFYSFSTTICVPTSKSQEVGLGLGAQAGEAKLTEILKEAGFTHVRRATETPTNMILEATVH